MCGAERDELAVQSPNHEDGYSASPPDRPLSFASAYRSGIAGSAIKTLAIKIVGAALALLMMIVLGNTLSPAAFGRFGFAFSLATFAAALGGLGWRTTVVPFAAVYEDASDTDALRCLLRTGYGATTLGGGLLAVLLVIYGMTLSDAAERPVYVAAGGFALALALAEYQAAAQRGLGNLVVALAPRDIVWRALVLAVVLWIGYSETRSVSAADAVWVATALLAAIVLLQAFALRQTNPFHLLSRSGASPERFKWTPTLRSNWGREVIQSASPNISVIVVGLALSPVEAGAFFAAMRIASQLNLMQIASNMMATHLLAKSFHTGDVGRCRQICNTVTLMFGTAAIAVFVLVASFAGRLLSLFDSAFSGYALVLLILSTAHLSNVLGGMTGSIMTASKQQDRDLIYLSVSHGFAIACMWPMGRAFGSVGVATAVLAGYLLYNTLVNIFISTEYSISLFYWPFRRVSR